MELTPDSDDITMYEKYVWDSLMINDANIDIHDGGTITTSKALFLINSEIYIKGELTDTERLIIIQDSWIRFQDCTARKRVGNFNWLKI